MLEMMPGSSATGPVAAIDGALVLVVEDEATLAQTIELYLRNEGYRTERALDGERALELFRAAKPDLVLLDIGLPKVDGLEVLRIIRTQSDVPVVVLTARSEEVDELVGLGMGASDYLVKPVSARKLMARVRLALRTARGRGERTASRLRVGPLEVDRERVQARVHGVALRLTPTEFRLLEHLARTPERVIGRSELYEAALPEGDALERAVDIHITNLRRKLREHGAGGLIETVRGVGYVLDPGDA
jgi:two-component system, OmpR family, response regulator AdeR